MASTWDGIHLGGWNALLILRRLSVDLKWLWRAERLNVGTQLFAMSHIFRHFFQKLVFNSRSKPTLTLVLRSSFFASFDQSEALRNQKMAGQSYAIVFKQS